MGSSSGPNYTKTGLSLILDAANTKSYPGSGTAWADLSGNSNTGTLTNGPTFNNSNGGNIVFDGVNDYVSIPNNSSFNVTDNITVEMWVRLETTQTNNLGFLIKYADGYLFYVTNDANRRFRFDSRNGDGTYYTTTGTTNIQDGVWKYLAAQKGGLSYKVYVNGLLEGSTTANNIGSIAANVNLNLGTDGSTYLNGRIGIFKIYNRVLSADEILQNYNSTKSRFGL